ncbi:MAG: hypothetical protein V1867_04150 [Candidatus Falkowbacteria bacterium]
MAKRKKRKFRKNLLAIQINSEKYVREHTPWLIEPSITREPQKRVHRKEDLFISR